MGRRVVTTRPYEAGATTRGAILRSPMRLSGSRAHGVGRARSTTPGEPKAPRARSDGSDAPRGKIWIRRMTVRDAGMRVDVLLRRALELSQLDFRGRDRRPRARAVPSLLRSGRADGVALAHVSADVRNALRHRGLSRCQTGEPACRGRSRPELGSPLASTERPPVHELTVGWGFPRRRAPVRHPRSRAAPAPRTRPYAIARGPRADGTARGRRAA